MKRFPFPYWLVAVFEIPVHALADVPVIDKTVLDEARRSATEDDAQNRERPTRIAIRSTPGSPAPCTGHAPQDDPVGAANANR